MCTGRSVPLRSQFHKVAIDLYSRKEHRFMQSVYVAMIDPNCNHIAQICEIGVNASKVSSHIHGVIQHLFHLYGSRGNVKGEAGKG
jgi:hypothetical protein